MESCSKISPYESGTLRTTQKRTFFIRAFFDFDAMKDSSLPGKGLSFRHGDVLHVLNAGDEEWWQAKKLVGDLVDQGIGIIPSKMRVERRERSRAKNVKFLGRESDSTGVCFCLLYGFSSTPIELQTPSYEIVKRQEINYSRPVVLLGMFKDQLGDALIAEHPELFETCVPHTTRARKDNEVDGRDYFFVASRDQMERDMKTSLFVEAGEYNNHLYGTSIQSIREVAERGKHCLLDVSGNAVKRLQLAGIQPISIFIKPRSIEAITEFNRRMTADQARSAFDKLINMERDFSTCFSAILVGGSQEEVYRKVKEVIEKHSREQCVWLPTNEKL
ncbi:hypothetical protein HELRODRAFT_73143 [Helobdella robusta]|uniref:Guanylate kinase-like domain-containing protein n=1 Tax=Helobdella robusta TaxID=6412 RepID=T1G1A8_HELRO|nr:hypothetical protein HELRODRAFT_73143 [Helobdella robusta]ESO10057.1 hypothetical protein HELRODRAFT_73143 [Helobdella robusta]